MAASIAARRSSRRAASTSRTEAPSFQFPVSSQVPDFRLELESWQAGTGMTTHADHRPPSQPAQRRPGQRPPRGSPERAARAHRGRSAGRARGAAPVAESRGLPARDGVVARGRAGGRRGARVRRRPDRSQLRARHDLRRGGAQPAVAQPGHRSDAAGGGDDGVGQRGSGGRGHAARRPRLHSEAVGQRAAALDHPHADRAQSGAPEGPAPRSGELPASRRRPAEADGRVARRCRACCR